MADESANIGEKAKPRFSVVVPAYNASRTLSETLESIRCQDFDDWECVVVDDGSADETPATVAGFRDRDSRFALVQQSNMGAAVAYKTAISAASSDLLVICAADDLLLPTHLKAMDEFIRVNPGFDIYSSNGQYLYDDSGLRRVVYEDSDWRSERSLSLEQVIMQCFYSVGAVVRRSAYEAVGGHRRGVYTDDYDLWLRAMARGAKHKYTPQVLSVHRVSDFQQSANLKRLYESNLDVYRQLLRTTNLRPEEREAVQVAMESSRAQIAGSGIAVALDEQAQMLRGLVERLVGPQQAGAVMRAIHSVSWVSRPLRRILARRRARRT